MRYFYTTPMRLLLDKAREWNLSPMNPVSYSEFAKSFDASFQLIERITRQYPKPQFGITKSVVGNTKVKVFEEIYIKKPFCNLLHFRKDGDFSLPKLLIFAPMSGHYATLCRGTVEALLPHYDVYITDWMNVRDIPLSMGEFTLDDFIDYSMEFIRKIDGNLHLLAVCQPAVPVIAAVSLLAAENSSHIPQSMILIGGPIDARINPTEVNIYADRRPMNWFERNVITRVPINYPGFMRAVYPGFIQLSGFMAMNAKRHMGEHMKLFQHLVKGDGESTDKHIKFYDEYLAVMDLPAEFYLQTIQTVFKDYALPKGEMVSRGRVIDLDKIKDTSLLVIEGEFDDITGLGQTKAAIDLCSNLPKSKKKYLFQKGVGHYGLFNGSNFRNYIVPEICQFTKKHHQ